jgi:tRNA(fMet)-specific endonuclease VapC
VTQLLMLDTNTVSYLISNNPPSVRRRASKVPPGSVCISVISEAELRHGALRKGSPALTARIEAMLDETRILPWESSAAIWFARMHHQLRTAGTPLQLQDTMIAAHALAVGATLVTSDQAFARVGQRLRRENWTEAR